MGEWGIFESKEVFAFVKNDVERRRSNEVVSFGHKHIKRSKPTIVLLLFYGCGGRRFALAMLKAYRLVELVLFALLRSSLKSTEVNCRFLNALVQILPFGTEKDSSNDESAKWLRGQDLNHTTFGLWARRATKLLHPATSFTV